MKKLIERWKAETPLFFKNVIRIAVVIAGVTGSLWGLNESMNLQLDAIMLNIIKYSFVASTSVSLISKFAKENKS